MSAHSEQNKTDTSGHATVERRKITWLQLYTKKYTLQMDAKDVKNLQGRVHQ